MKKNIYIYKVKKITKTIITIIKKIHTSTLRPLIDQFIKDVQRPDAAKCTRNTLVTLMLGSHIGESAVQIVLSMFSSEEILFLSYNSCRCVNGRRGVRGGGTLLFSILDFPLVVCYY